MSNHRLHNRELNINEQDVSECSDIPQLNRWLLDIEKQIAGTEIGIERGEASLSRPNHDTQDQAYEERKLQDKRTALKNLHLFQSLIEKRKEDIYYQRDKEFLNAGGE